MVDIVVDSDLDGFVVGSNNDWNGVRDLRWTWDRTRAWTWDCWTWMGMVFAVPGSGLEKLIAEKVLVGDSRQNQSLEGVCFVLLAGWSYDSRLDGWFGRHWSSRGIP